MLRRMKIGTRVNLLIAVPLVALVVLMGVSYVSLQRASVRGTEYKQLKAAQDLRSDIVPPPVNLLEAWTDVNHISVLVSAPVSIPTNKEIVARPNRSRDFHRHFRIGRDADGERHSLWQAIVEKGRLRDCGPCSSVQRSVAVIFPEDPDG